MMYSRYLRSVSLVALSAALLACPSGEEEPEVDPNPSHPVEPPSSYSFDHMAGGEGSSVSNSGQIHRQALISGMKNYLSGLTAEADANAGLSANEVLANLLFFFDYEAATGADLPHGLSFQAEPAQTNWGDLSDKNLRSKLAGNDSGGTDHKDWSSEFVGWDGVASPTALVDAWAGMIASAAELRAVGTIPNDPISGEPIAKVYLNDQGHDLQQLAQKFLMGAVSFSQGTDDYLDSDVDGKGLKSSNAVEAGKSYSKLAHAWDEAFGYFGAAHDYNEYTDDEIAGKGGREDWQGHHDSNSDGVIDLKSEVNWGHSVNAAKRDRGSADGAKTDYTKEAFDAFLAGRHLIQHAGETLSADEMTALEGHRDIIVAAWEKAIAATGVHYINDCLQDLAVDPLPYANYAKHWGELKGFTLGLQFNPRSPVSSADFVQLHSLLGNGPKLPGQAGYESYADDLRAARTLLGAAYGFAAANLGDDNGENGW